MTALLSTVALLITRDAMTILPVTVPAHEVPIQMAVFGEDNVQVLEDKTEPVELMLTGEAERLAARYGEEALTKAYGANFKSQIAAAAKEAVVKEQQGAKRPSRETAAAVA